MFACVCVCVSVCLSLSGVRLVCVCVCVCVFVGRVGVWVGTGLSAENFVSNQKNTEKAQPTSLCGCMESL